MISRSLHVPGSPSSAFTTKYFGLQASCAMISVGLRTPPKKTGTRTRPRLPAVAGFVHEAPLHAAGEARPTSPPKPGRLHLVDDPVGSLEENLFGLVPVPSPQGPFQPEAPRRKDQDQDEEQEQEAQSVNVSERSAPSPPVMSAIQVGEDSVFIAQRTKLGLLCFLLLTSRKEY